MGLRLKHESLAFFGVLSRRVVLSQHLGSLVNADADPVGLGRTEILHF